MLFVHIGIAEAEAHFRETLMRMLCGLLGMEGGMGLETSRFVSVTDQDELDDTDMAHAAEGKRHLAQALRSLYGHAHPGPRDSDVQEYATVPSMDLNGRPNSGLRC